VVTPSASRATTLKSPKPPAASCARSAAIRLVGRPRIDGGARKPELRRHHADNLEILLTDAFGATDDRRLAPVALLPMRTGDQQRQCARGGALARELECVADGGGDTEHCSEIRADPLQLQDPAVGVARRSRAGKADLRGKHAALRAQCLRQPRRQRDRKIDVAQMDAQLLQPRVLGIRKRLAAKCPECAEQGGIREHHDRNQCDHQQRA